MAGKRNLTRLSAGEMELMRMLWERGPLTLARAHEMFDRYAAPIAYPTMPGASTDIRRSACRGCKPSATSCTTKWRSATSTRGPRPMHTRNAAGFAATSRIWRLHSVALPEHPGALLHRLYHGHRRFFRRMRRWTAPEELW